MQKGSIERFTPENIARRRAFIQWRSSVDPQKFLSWMRPELKTL